MSEVVQLTTNATDKDKAEAIRAEIRPILEQACAIIQRAKGDGLVVGFSLAPDQFGIQRVGDISVTKPL